MLHSIGIPKYKFCMLQGIRSYRRYSRSRTTFPTVGKQSWADSTKYRLHTRAPKAHVPGKKHVQKCHEAGQGNIHGRKPAFNDFVFASQSEVNATMTYKGSPDSYVHLQD
jgi:hypothetical protein